MFTAQYACDKCKTITAITEQDNNLQDVIVGYCGHIMKMMVSA